MEGRVGKEGVKSIYLLPNNETPEASISRINESLNVPKPNNSNNKTNKDQASSQNGSNGPICNGINKNNSSLVPNPSNGNNGTEKNLCNGGDVNKTSEANDRITASSSNDDNKLEDPAPSSHTKSSVKQSTPTAEDEDELSLSPIIVLGSGEVFGRCESLGTWLQLGECEAVRRTVTSLYTSLPVGSKTNTPLVTLLRHTSAQ